MIATAEALYARQVARAKGADGTVDFDHLGQLVVATYNAADDDRRLVEQTAKKMAGEIEQANQALMQSVVELREQNLRFGVALDNMANGLALFGRSGRLVVCNRRQMEILAIESDRVWPGCSMRQFLEASAVLSPAAIEDRLRLADARQFGELEQTLLDGRQVRMVLRPTSGHGFLTSCEDVTERHQAAARIAFLAYHDPLTELPNRALLRRQLEQALAAGPCVVLFLDLDGFKGVNDTLGHGAGDLLLQAVAGRLKRLVRPEDTLARLGGDEFAAVIMGALPAATAMAERMLNAVAAPFEIDANIVTVATSIGIAEAPRHGTTVDALLRHADTALYQAKAAGRGRARVFAADMAETRLDRRALGEDLRDALRQHQLEVFYQPQFDVKDSRLTGFEALLRWRHPTRGLISPDDFVPLAEETGLIVGIGAWVLDQACHEACRWPEDVSIAVNVSTVQLRGGGFDHIVLDVLEATRLNPDRLVLEVTESTLLADSPTVLETMHRLRVHGVHIALDDFGTGFSSLSYVHNFPVDRLKIDRSFVTALGDNPKALAIIRVVTGLARGLGIPVIAEGVETLGQLEILAAEQCSNVQGFLYSRAVTAKEAAALVASPATKAA